MKEIMEQKIFTRDSILIDPSYETEKISKFIKENLSGKMKKRGAIVGVSGGIDSALVLALCCEAVGNNKTIAIYLPEKESSSDNLDYINELVDKFNVKLIVEDITSALEGFGCYRRRDDAIKELFPSYRPVDKMKITLPEKVMDKDVINYFTLHIIDENNVEQKIRLPHSIYMKIVAATNFKQRTRMAMLYHHAELNNYGVIGTANKNEYEMGFFVKYGDSGVDIKPIVHLFKSQIYQISEYLGVPKSIRRRIPTSDTYSAMQSQEEFFFRLSFEYLDAIWFAMEHDVPISIIANELGLKESQVENVISDLKRKLKSTEYLRSPIPSLAN